MIIRTLCSSKMKYAFLLGLFIFSNAYAINNSCKEDFEVLERKGNHNYKFVKKKLDDLLCNNSFDGKYFRIVYKKNDDAVSFDENEELVRRAANVYYHLTKARDYWANDLKSEYVINHEKIVVRLQITNGFSRLGHYANEDQVENYNNAWTIPAGETPSWVSNPDVWGREIWFSPMRKVESRNLVTSTGNNPVTAQLLGVKDPVINYTENSLIQNTLNHLAFPDYQSTTILDMATKHLGVLAIMYGAIEVSKKLDKVFMNKYYYLDTSMIPEVIYHEFSHVALSDELEPVHSNPVIEGMADYFATRIAGTEKMYKSIKDFSTNAEKNANNKKMYSPHFEFENNATSDFTLGLLWSIRGEFENMNSNKYKDGLVKSIDKFVYKSRKELNHESSILELTKAMRLTARDREVCRNIRLCVGALNRALIKKGF